MSSEPGHQKIAARLDSRVRDKDRSKPIMVDRALPVVWKAILSKHLQELRREPSPLVESRYNYVELVV